MQPLSMPIVSYLLQVSMPSQNFDVQSGRIVSYAFPSSVLQYLGIKLSAPTPSERCGGKCRSVWGSCRELSSCDEHTSLSDVMQRHVTVLPSLFYLLPIRPLPSKSLLLSLNDKALAHRPRRFDSRGTTAFSHAACRAINTSPACDAFLR